MKKKLVTAVCAVLLSVLLLPAMGGVKAAEQTEAATWFKEQLNSDAVIFYNAMEHMSSSGLFKSGTGSVELTADGQISQERLKAYAAGNSTLAKAFQQARDAFIQDHPELFYVDFTKLTFRAGMQNGKYVAFINNGTYTNYYAEGFTSTAQVEQAIQEVTAAKEAIKSKVDDKLKAEVTVTTVHDALIEQCDFSYPADADTSVSGIYGALVKGKANCEGYSRTMKWILDDYQIPTVLVTGVGVNSKGNEETHMWNEVKIDNQWYLVDATWDDPVGGSRRNTYLLVGQDAVSPNHTAIGEFSYGSITFEYPALNDMDLSAYQASQQQPDYGDTEEISSDENNGLKVWTVPGEDDKGIGYTAYYISFEADGRKMNVKEAYEQGYQICYRVTLENTGTNSDSKESSPVTVSNSEDTQVGPWCDMNAFAITNIDDHSSAVKIFQKCYMQFCVTKDKPDNGAQYTKDLTEYEGIPMTRKIATPSYNTTYKIPAFVRTSSPILGKCIEAGKKQHYRVEYDDKLIPSGPEEPYMEVSTSENVNYKLENLTITPSTFKIGDKVRQSTIFEFDFTPDNKYQTYINVYTLRPKNLVSVTNGAEPKEYHISTTFRMNVICPCYVAKGTFPNAFVVASPTLIVNEEMDIFDFDSEGRKPNSLDVRLVASKKENEEEKVLTDTLPDSGKIKSSATFDISLSCRDIAAKLKSGAGYNLTIALPYPEGFNYEDNKDVEFKAYHYTLNKDTQKYEPEELICKITPQGLVVIANRFSPFSVVAFEKGTVEAARNDKTVTVSNETGGGKIYTTINGETIAVSGVYPFESGETEKTYEIKAEDGYVIDKIIVNDEAVALDANTTEYTYAIKQSDLAEDGALKVYFIAATVLEEEKKENITPVIPNLDPTVTDPEEPVYSEGTLTSSDGKVTLTGKFKKDVSLTASEVTSREIQEAFKNYNKDANVIYMTDVNLSEANASQGELTLSFLLGKDYNGKKLTLLHYVNGAVKVEGKEIETLDGILSSNVASLSPFAIIDETKKEVEDPAKPGDPTKPTDSSKPNNPSGNVQTGDQTSLAPMLIVAGAALIAIILLVYLKIRNRNKK